MKHCFKKSLCILLTVLMLSLSLVPLALAAEEEYPIVYLSGYGASLYDANGNRIDAKDVDKDYVLNATKEVLKEMPANPNGDWSRYCDALYNAFAPLYDDVRLNKDGEPVDGGAAHIYRSKNRLPRKYSNYGCHDYHFNYDWRIDPYESAKELGLYINNVLSVTGKSKVTLVGRCLGACIVAAYLEMTENVENKVANVIFNIPSVGGIAVAGAIFSGNIVVDDEALDRFLNDNTDRKPLLEDTALQSLLVSAVSLARYCKVLGFTTEALMQIYKRVYKNLVPRLALASYGSYPAFWSMVGTDYYEEARDFIFAGKEEEYAGMIEKTDHFYYSVTARLPELLKELDKKGINFSYIAKYNGAIVPLYEGCDVQGDGVSELKDISGGATSAKLREVLPESYIEAAKANGTDKYISADRMVDASTCLFPDRTWFVKDLPHGLAPNCLDRLTEYISRGNGDVTVFSSEQYPQYMTYHLDDESLTPGVSSEQTKREEPKDFFKALFDFLTRLFRYLKDAFQKKLQK